MQVLCFQLINHHDFWYVRDGAVGSADAVLDAVGVVELQVRRQRPERLHPRAAGLVRQTRLLLHHQDPLRLPDQDQGGALSPVRTSLN